MARRALGCIAAVLIVACTRAKKEPAPAPMSVHAAPAPSASVARAEDASWQSDPPKTWTDRRVLDGLVADCDFLPPEHVRTDDDMGTPADLFRCTSSYEQSCVFDPCIAAGEGCKERCGSTCRSCGETCVAACTSCKAAANDDAGRRGCASRCAECKQTCTRTMDRCASGGCSHAYDVCGKAMKGAYAANHCAATCAGYKKCVTACGASSDTECSTHCRTRFDAQFEACRDRCNAGPDCIVKCYMAGCSSNLCEGS